MRRLIINLDKLSKLILIYQTKLFALCAQFNSAKQFVLKRIKEMMIYINIDEEVIFY